MRSFNEELVSNLKVRSRSSSGIGGTLIAFLGFSYLESEFLV